MTNTLTNMVLTTFVALALPLTASAQDTSYEFTVTDGFNGPESCIWDETTQSWFVSNMAKITDDFTSADGQGWISKLDANGMMLEEKWIEGFNSPFGQRISNGILYVADINVVHGIETRTGKIVEEHTFGTAVLLNDIAIDDENGTGYVSDIFGNAIHSFTPGKSGAGTMELTSEELKAPNGMSFKNGALYVANLVDFDPDHLGAMLKIDMETKAITQVSSEMAKFDGLEIWGDGFLASDFFTSRLIAYDPNGNTETIVDLMTDQNFGPAADIGTTKDGQVICVPNLNDSVGFVRFH